jgi:hypothetical protein
MADRQPGPLLRPLAEGCTVRPPPRFGRGRAAPSTVRRLDHRTTIPDRTKRPTASARHPLGLTEAPGTRCRRPSPAGSDAWKIGGTTCRQWGNTPRRRMAKHRRPGSARSRHRRDRRGPPRRRNRPSRAKSSVAAAGAKADRVPNGTVGHRPGSPRDPPPGVERRTRAIMRETTVRDLDAGRSVRTRRDPAYLDWIG